MNKTFIRKAISLLNAGFEKQAEREAAETREPIKA